MWIISFIYYFYLFRFAQFFVRERERNIRRNWQTSKKMLYVSFFPFTSYYTHLEYFFVPQILFGWLLFWHHWSFFFVRFEIKPKAERKKERNDLCETILLHIAYDFKWQNSMQWRKRGGFFAVVVVNRPTILFCKTLRANFLFSYCNRLSCTLQHSSFAFQLKFRIKFVLHWNSIVSDRLLLCLTTFQAK